MSVSLPEALPPTRAAADTADRPLWPDPPVAEDRLEGDAVLGDAGVSAVSVVELHSTVLQAIGLNSRVYML